MLTPLPESRSKFWQFSEKYSVSIDNIHNSLCHRHKFDLFNAKRELTCINCGLTGRFTPSTLNIDIENKLIKITKKLKDNPVITEHDLNNIF